MIVIATVSIAFGALLVAAGLDALRADGFVGGLAFLSGAVFILAGFRVLA